MVDQGVGNEDYVGYFVCRLFSTAIEDRLDSLENLVRRAGAIDRSQQLAIGVILEQGARLRDVRLEALLNHFRAVIQTTALDQPVVKLGLVDVKVAAIDTDWSGLKIVWRKELR